MRILMDAVLPDPFENGMVVSCPRRVIDLDPLGRINVVILSHGYSRRSRPPDALHDLRGSRVRGCREATHRSRDLAAPTGPRLN